MLAATTPTMVAAHTTAAADDTTATTVAQAVATTNTVLTCPLTPTADTKYDCGGGCIVCGRGVGGDDGAASGVAAVRQFENCFETPTWEFTHRRLLHPWSSRLQMRSFQSTAA